MPTFVNGVAVEKIQDYEPFDVLRFQVFLLAEDGLDWTTAPTDATDLVITFTPSQNGGVEELVLPLTKNIGEGGGGLWHAIEQLKTTVKPDYVFDIFYMSFTATDGRLFIVFNGDLPYYTPFRIGADIRPARKGLRFGIPHYQDVKGANMVPRSRSATRRDEFTHPNPTWAGARPFILRDNPFVWFFLDETEMLRAHDDKRTLFSDPLMFDTDASVPWAGDRIAKIHVGGGAYAEATIQSDMQSVASESVNGIPALANQLHDALVSNYRVDYNGGLAGGPYPPMVFVIQSTYNQSWALDAYFAGISIYTKREENGDINLLTTGPNEVINTIRSKNGLLIIGYEPYSIDEMRVIMHTDTTTEVIEFPGTADPFVDDTYTLRLQATRLNQGVVAGAIWLNTVFVDVRDQVQHMAERYGLPDVVVSPAPFAARGDAGPKPVAGSVTGAHHQKPHEAPRVVPRDEWSPLPPIRAVLPPDTDLGAGKPPPPPDHVLGPAKKEPVMEHELPDTLKRVTLPAVPPPPPMGVPGEPVTMDAGRTDDGQVVFTVAGWQLGDGRSLTLSVFAREGMDLHKLDAQVSLKAGLLRPTVTHALAQALRNGHGTQLVVYEHDWGVSVRGMAGTTVVDAALTETGA